MLSADLKVLNDFKHRRNIYKRLEQTAADIINNIITQNGFFVMEINHRTKDAESLKGKLQRKSGKYADILDITDLVGIRIICYFSDTVDEIAMHLDEYFTIDWENTIDKRATIKETQFGYLSLHYICSLPDNGMNDPEICNIPFEIQMRTVLQHAWAEIEHDLGYKSSFGVPRQIRREFSQVASLLEVADKAFIEIRDKSRYYTQSIRTLIMGNDADSVLLDRISLREYLNINTDIMEFRKKLKDELNVDTENTDPESYVEQLYWFNIDTIGDLSKMFSDNIDYVYYQIKDTVDTFEIDIISTNTILKHLCYGELLRGGYNEKQIRKFLSISIHDSKKLERTLKKLTVDYN